MAVGMAVGIQTSPPLRTSPPTVLGIMVGLDISNACAYYGPGGVANGQRTDSHHACATAPVHAPRVHLWATPRPRDHGQHHVLGHAHDTGVVQRHVDHPAPHAHARRRWDGLVDGPPAPRARAWLLPRLIARLPRRASCHIRPAQRRLGNLWLRTRPGFMGPQFYPLRFASKVETGRICPMGCGENKQGRRKTIFEVRRPILRSTPAIPRVPVYGNADVGDETLAAALLQAKWAPFAP